MRRPFAVVVIAGALFGGLATPLSAAQDGAGWRRWGGPSGDFISAATGLADSWPAGGPPVLWSRPLGTGHSAILVDEGRLFTQYRVGNGLERGGPWDEEEIVVALDASDGTTLWEHAYPSRHENFDFGAGPHATPLVVGDRLFAAGTNKQLFAFDKRTGEMLWSHDLVVDFAAPPNLIRAIVKSGYGNSPIAYEDTVIVPVGGPGQSLMAFRQSDGEVVWRSGDFLFSPSPPVLIDLDGQTQLVYLAGASVVGLDPDDGRVLWAVPHDPGNDLNMVAPQWGDDNILFFSSGYRAGSRAIQLTLDGTITRTKELWFTSRVPFMFLNIIRRGSYVYGTSGTFGPAFMTALDVRTGEPAWQQRGFKRASLLYADGKFIVMDEDGDLALTRMTPEGMTVLARAPLFDTTSWTVPTLNGTTLYARDRQKIVALDLGAAESPTPRAVAADGTSAGVAAPSGGHSEPPAPAADTHPDLSGIWELDRDGSHIGTPAALAGLGDGGAPRVLFVTQAVNGTLLLSSEDNPTQARAYAIGGESPVPILADDGEPNTMTIASRWEDGQLVSEGRHQRGVTVIDVREVMSLSDDMQTLTVQVTIEGLPAAGTSRLVYRRS
ncbi:MAG TPA: PQQ-binding-like beta-propeller repeat protein [Acidobacteriota bacterium]|nr:PQQ-binding-like beta-propeller repeat protein [Acidobacteriota bacterium]